jgi:glycogen operon protein
VLRRQRFYSGGRSDSEQLADISWFRADGSPMSEADWHSPRFSTVVAHISGDDPGRSHVDGKSGPGEDLLVVLHPGADDVEVMLPGAPWAANYELLLDTSANDLAGFPATVGTPTRIVAAGTVLPVAGHTLLLLRARRRPRPNAPL